MRIPKSKPRREWRSKRIVRLPSTTVNQVSTDQTQPRSGKCKRQGRKLTGVQRPRIAPPVESRSNLDIVESSRYVRNDPKDQEQTHPRHTHNHSHVLTRQAQRNHTAKVQHPIDHKRRAAKCHRIAFALDSDLGVTSHGVGIPKVDLERHTDEGVGEREHKVSRESSTPAPDDELSELERWVIGRGDVLHVDRHVEREAEETYDDKIYNRIISIFTCAKALLGIEKLTNQADRNGRDTGVWEKWPEIVFRESNCGIDCLRHILHIRQNGWIAGILQHHLCPLLAYHALRFCHEGADDRQHEVEPIGVVPRVLVDQLTRSQGVVGCVSVGNSGVK